MKLRQCFCTMAVSISLLLAAHAGAAEGPLWVFNGNCDQGKAMISTLYFSRSTTVSIAIQSGDVFVLKELLVEQQDKVTGKWQEEFGYLFSLKKSPTFTLLDGFDGGDWYEMLTNKSPNTAKWLQHKNPNDCHFEKVRKP